MAIIAKGKIIHNGNEYNVGDVIPDLKEEEAKRLLVLGVAEEQRSSKTKKEQ